MEVLGVGVRKGALGAIGGGIAGAVGGAAIPGSFAMHNAKKYGRSGNSSLMTAQSLNANGDIVLGMHNSRRG
jgi:hypothetical protein